MGYSTKNISEWKKVSIENIEEWNNELVMMFALTLMLKKGSCILNGEKINLDNQVYSNGVVNRKILKDKLANIFNKEKEITLNFLDEINNDNEFVFNLKVGDYFTRSLGEEKSVQFWKEEDFLKRHIITNDKCILIDDR